MADQMGAPLSSVRGDWRTPMVVLRPVGMSFNRMRWSIELDPCASCHPRYHFAGHNMTKADDGLLLSWAAVADTAFVNPEYGKGLADWVSKCDYESREGVSVIALLPARVDTRWFQICWDTATAICFWRGRIRFEGAENSAPFPSAVVFWNANPWPFRNLGKVVNL